MKSALIYISLNVLSRLEQAEFFIGLMRLFKLRSITIPLLTINPQLFKNWAFSQDTCTAKYSESAGVT